MIATYILMAVIAYAIGSVNFSVILSKRIAGFDVREKGSGNAGTTNMLRSVGKGAAALTLLLDILKGLVAVLIAKYIVAKLSQNTGTNEAILVQPVTSASMRARNNMKNKKLCKVHQNILIFKKVK